LHRLFNFLLKSIKLHNIYLMLTLAG